MGAIQFISSNPTTAAIRTNEARDLQQAQAAESLFAARDARQQRADMDAAYGAAADELAAKAKPMPSALATVAPAQMYNEMGSPVPATDLAKATPGATIPQAAPQQSVLSTVTADSGSGNVSSLRGMRNSGKIRFELEQAQQKRNVDAEAAAIKAIGNHNWQLAEELDKKHGLNLNLSAQNPTSLQVIGMFASSLERLKLEPAQVVAHLDASTKKFKEVYAQTHDRNKALEAGSEAGMTAAHGVRPKGTGNLVETPDGYFNRDTGDFEKDKNGKVLRVPDRRLNFNPNAGGSSNGPGGANSKGAKYDVDGDGNRVILYRDGTMVYPKDAAGNPVKIKAGTNEDQKFVRKLVEGAERNRFTTDANETPVQRAKRLAGETQVGGAAPTAPQGRVRKYVPGQGFVDQQ